MGQRRRGDGRRSRGAPAPGKPPDRGRHPFSLRVTGPPCLDDHQKLRDPTRLRTRLFTPQGPFAQAVLGIFTSRFTSSDNSNFTRGLCLHRDYVASREFVAWKGGCCSGGPPAAGASGSLGPVLCFGPGLGCRSRSPEADGGWAWGRALQSGWQREGQKQRSPQAAFPTGREEGC